MTANVGHRFMRETLTKLNPSLSLFSPNITPKRKENKCTKNSEIIEIMLLGKYMVITVTTESVPHNIAATDGPPKTSFVHAHPEKYPKMDN
uniref:Uncharacterized protein n=1 Tax=Romanomermis culicivorax TaxID=13658 RepID=A0A915IA14_ROMCU